METVGGEGRPRGMSKPKISTMKALSEAIGISRPTLSRYFQDPSTVRASTSRKIEERLAEVDYVYNFLATRQNRKSTGLIGVIIPHLNDLFFTSLLEAIEKAARDVGYTIITQSSDGEPEVEARAVEKLRSMNADGAIIAPLGIAGSGEAFLTASEDFPIVFADSHPAIPVPNADLVGTNNTQSIGMIVDYLCETGQPPVFLSMPRLNSNALEREEAYRIRMGVLGFEPELIEVVGVAESWEFEAYGYEVMDSCFSLQRYTTATILCANDRLAIGAIRAANQHGLFESGRRGRRGLRIAGHDDHPLSRYVYPAITTVAQDIMGIARDAVRLLVHRMREDDDGKPVVLLKDASIKLREST